MKRLWFILVLVAMLLGASLSTNAATYYLRNDGTGADPDCSESSPCCVGAYDEADHNGATFVGNDVIYVCPDGGDFNLQVTTPSSGTSGNEIIYQGVYDAALDWPVFDEGFNAATDWLILSGFEVRPGVAETGTNTFEGGRFGECANGTRTWQAAEETAVTDWTKANIGIYAVGIGGTGGATTPTPQLYWRDKTDAGSFAAVGASGEVKYVNPGGCLTDEANLTTAEFGTSSGKTGITGVTCEQENSYQATSSTSLSTDQFTELQVGVSFADGQNGHEYEFSLYESAAQVGSASLATVTLALVCTSEYAPTLTGDISHPVGRYNAQEFAGYKYHPPADETICQVDFESYSVTGDIDAKDYYVRIFLLNGSDQLCGSSSCPGSGTGGLGTSDKVDGDTISSFSTITFTFSTPVSLSADTDYGIAIFTDTDGNLTDDPENDTSNYWNFYIDNNNNIDSILRGYFWWAYGSGTPPLTVSGSDWQDDVLTEVYTLQ